MSAYKDLQKKYDHLQGRMLELFRRLVKERDRLLVLAIKHCPNDHHDWKEIMNFSRDDE